MARSAWTLFLALPFTAVAAPVPKETEAEKIERLYGKVEDPEKDCTFKLDGNALKITLKGGKRYDYDMEGKVKNCPRLTGKEVKGDFVATTLVHAELPDGAKPAEGDMAEAGVGLILLGEKERFRRVGMHDFLDAKRMSMAVLFGCHGQAGVDIKGSGAGIYVRLTRKGEDVEIHLSTDRQKWVWAMTQGKVKEEAIRVGVYAFSNTKDDTTVTIDEFSVEQPKAEKK